MTSLPGAVRSRLYWPRLLVPVETLERHLVVARLLAAAASVLDVGGDPQLLSRLLPETQVTVANTAAPADVVLEDSLCPSRVARSTPRSASTSWSTFPTSCDRRISQSSSGWRARASSPAGRSARRATRSWSASWPPGTRPLADARTRSSNSIYGSACPTSRRAESSCRSCRRARDFTSTATSRGRPDGSGSSGRLTPVPCATPGGAASTAPISAC